LNITNLVDRVSALGYDDSLEGTNNAVKGGIETCDGYIRTSPQHVAHKSVNIYPIYSLYRVNFFSNNNCSLRYIIDYTGIKTVYLDNIYVSLL
jgi:hypothetical protein